MRTRHGRLRGLLRIMQGPPSSYLVRDVYLKPAVPGEGLALSPLRGNQLSEAEPMCLHDEGHQLMNPLYKQAACPECCVKHLLAAHALLPYPAHTVSRIEFMTGEWILTARAVILAQEVQVGYTGNIPVLTGVLAALEQVGDLGGVGSVKQAQVRACRKALPHEGMTRQASLADFIDRFLSDASYDAFAYANLIEAAREAPVDYAERLDALVREALDYFHDNALRDLSFNLLDIAIDIADAYELLPQENADGQT
jgi:hypothetical protein